MKKLDESDYSPVRMTEKETKRKPKRFGKPVIITKTKVEKK